MLAAWEPVTSPSDTLDGIGRAFFATFDEQDGAVVAVCAAVLMVAAAVVLVRWVRRETLRERGERSSLEERHLAALASATPAESSPAWVRLPAHLRMLVLHGGGARRVSFEECETLDVSGGAVTFLSRRPPVPGMPLQFTLDLHEKWPLALQGVVVRVDPPSAPTAPAAVEVALGPIPASAREHLVRWITREELQRISRARQGRPCRCCGRPLADDAADVHTTCAASGELQRAAEMH